MKQFKNYINGEWVPAQSGETFQDLNPANRGDVIGEFPKSGKAEIDAAVASARAAYKTWRLVPAPRRAEFLFKAAEEMVRRKEELAQEMTREMGKVISEARGDVQEAIDMMYFIAGEGRRAHGYSAPCELPNKQAWCERQPIGVCGLITPWNFPSAIPVWKLAPSLVMGNAVVFKPASDTPLLATRLVEILVHAGIPGGALNLVHGPGSVCGAALVSHPDVDLVSFTGSSDVGRDISSGCAPTFKRVSLEMGGKNAIIVMDDADLDLAVDGCIWGAFGTSGQRCTASSRIIVHKAVVAEFTKKMTERAKALRLGDGLLATTDVGPVINAAAAKKIVSYIEIGKAEGATLLCGGGMASGGALADGNFVQPTLFGDVKPGMRIAQEEIFGPVTVIIPVGSLDEAIDAANNTQFGLSASIFTSNVNNAFRAARDVYTGIFYMNAATIGAEIQFPFGGTRATGNGHREGGEQVLDVFSEWKTVYVDYSGTVQKAQIDV
ncbi:MAG TPA: aldehyde dehydrogenase family protein [Armatimonadota bacterium]|jgi:aldehyde dehydrogenase (NAD+)